MGYRRLRWAEDEGFQAGMEAASKAVSAAVDQIRAGGLGREEGTAHLKQHKAATSSPKTQDALSAMALPRMLVTPSRASATPNFITLSEWEGVVEAVDGESNTFSATLQDVDSEGAPEEYAEFFIEDLRQDDLALLQPGAIFRWVIGKREDEFGTVERTSRVVFRRLPAYSGADMSRANARAAELVNAINVE